MINSTMVKMVTSGFETLDEMLGGGFLPGSIVLLRGGPGSGKTTFAFEMAAKSLARSPTAKVLYVSLELEPQTAISHAVTFKPCYNLKQLVESNRLVMAEQKDFREAGAYKPPRLSKRGPKPKHGRKCWR